MSRLPRRTTLPGRGWLTLALTFVFLLLFRVEQNVAYILGVSTRELVTRDGFPMGAIVQLFAPYLHADAGHLVSTLVWVVPFGYFLERRRPRVDYVGFVVVAGFLTTTLAPFAFVVLGLSSGLGVGGSGIAYALVGREATARLRSLPRWRSLSRTEWGITAVAVAGLGLHLVSFVGPPADTSVVGHATGLAVGVVAGIGERYVSVDGE